MNDTGTQEVCLNHRRFAIRRLFSVGLAAAVTIFFAISFLLSIASPLPAEPAQEASTANVATEAIHYDSGGFNIDGFVAKPAGGGKHPAVLVIHDNQGLNDSIREIAKQFAAAGFYSLAADFIFRLSGTSILAPGVDG